MTKPDEDQFPYDLPSQVTWSQAQLVQFYLESTLVKGLDGTAIIHDLLANEHGMFHCAIMSERVSLWWESSKAPGYRIDQWGTEVDEDALKTACCSECSAINLCEYKQTRV